MIILLIVLASFAVTEVVGYWLHRLLHSEKIPSLSKAHMWHHLKDYGPNMEQQTEAYVSGARKRTNVVGLGLEWLLPAAILVGGVVGVLSLLGVGALYQVIVIASMLSWTAIMFNHMHDAMHRTSYWMLKVPLLNRWFKKARHLHDVHHMRLSDDGRMPLNFGISFFPMDRLFGTFQKEIGPFNEKGYEEALKVYGSLLKE